MGSRVAVVSPASAAKAELVERGVERLKASGYEPVVMPHCAGARAAVLRGNGERARWRSAGGV